ncbi:LysR family transcriptional regulator [Vibrio pectenicida]|nr:LysR family transcriptional regulator [Vibrio pectenicida]
MIQYTLDQIFSFTLAAEHGSLAKASRASGKDRATLSEHVSNLEIALNTTLFERGGNSLAITKEGVQLLRLANSLLRQAKGLQSYADVLSLPEQLHFRVALDASLPNDFILSVNNVLKEHNPNAKVDWMFLGRDKAIPKLVDSELDAVIMLKNDQSMTLLPKAGLCGCYLGKIPSKLYTSAESHLQDLTPIKFRDLIHDTRYVLQSTFEAGLAEKGSFSGHQVVLGSVDLIASFLGQGGWAVLPALKVLDKYPDIKPLEAEFLNMSWRIEHMLMSRDGIAGDCFKFLIKTIKMKYKELT